MPRTAIEVEPKLEYLGILDDDDQLDEDLDPAAESREDPARRLIRS